MNPISESFHFVRTKDCGQRSPNIWRFVARISALSLFAILAVICFGTQAAQGANQKFVKDTLNVARNGSSFSNRIQAGKLQTSTPLQGFAKNQRSQGTRSGNGSSKIQLTPKEKAWISAHPVIRASAEPGWPPFDFLGEDGNVQGITIDHMELAARRVGLQLEFDTTGSWDERQEKLRRHKLDVVGAVAVTTERSKFLNFTQPYLRSPYVLATRQTDSARTPEEIKPGPVAVERGFVTETLLREKYPYLDLLFTENTEEALEAVASGTARAYAGQRAVIGYIARQHLITSVKIGDKSLFPGGDHRIGVRKDWPVLATIIQKGLDTITPKERNEILYKWIPIQGDGTIFQHVALSEDEKLWLAKHPKIRLGVDPAWPPIEFVSEQKHYKGITADYMRILSSLLDVDMIPAPGLSWESVMSEVYRGKLDILTAVVPTKRREQFLNFSKPYISHPIVIFTQDKLDFITGLQDLAGKRVAVEKGYVGQEYLEGDHPQIQQVLVNNTLEGLTKVSLGEADAYVGNLTVATYLIKQNGLTNVKVAAPTPYRYDLCMGVRKDWPELIPILNKALDTISEQERIGIRERWLAVRYDVGVDYGLLWKVVGFAALILALGTLWLGQVQRQKKRLQISEQRFQQAISAVSESIWEWNVKTGERHFTPGLFLGLGYGPDDIPDSDAAYLSLIHPDDIAEGQKSLTKHEQDKARCDAMLVLDYRLRRADGSFAYVMAAGNVTERDEQGQPVKRAGTLQDVTVQKKAELAVIEHENQLVELNERLSLATNVVSLGIWDWDIKAGTVSWDDRMYEIYGIPKTGSMPHDRWKIAVHPDDLPKAYTSLDKVITQGGKDQVEYRIRRPDGSVRHIYAAQTAIKDSRDEPIRIVGVNWDITERKEAESQFEDLINALPVPVVVVNGTGNIMMDNSQARREIGGEASLVGRNTREFYADQDERNKVLTLLAEEGIIEHKQVQYRIDSGDIIDCLLSIIPIHFEGQSALLAVMINLTERIKMEQRLADAKQAAEEASRFKSDFLANMSHEIRTPMNAIVGLSHLALLTDLTDKQRDYLKKIQSASDSLLALINDILDFSKIEADRLTMEKIAFQLDQVLENQADLFRLKAEEKEIELLFDIKPGVPFALVGDPLRLGQVLTNLISNSLKFTDRGEIVLAVELLQQEYNNVQLLFSVKDTGIGIEKEQISNLFRSFYQVDASTTRRHGGTGLGLAISQKLVNLMRGKIEVDSQAGKGSVFRFSAEFGAQSQPDFEQRSGAPNLRGMNVLVVDDNPVALSILATMLESFSFKVSKASNAKDALAILQSAERKIDLVVMDWLMPEMNGIEAARIIKNIKSQTHTPMIIMITAHAREEVMRQSKDLDFADCLLKPINPSALFDAIVKACGGVSERSAPQNKVATPSSPDNQSARILVVEDNEDNQLVAKELLENLGASVEIARHGSEAVAMASERHFDLILMDIQMPNMDGYEATQRIRRLGLVDLPIIALTAHAMVGDREKSLKAGMNDHIAKPIDPDILSQTIHHWLKQDTVARKPRISKQPASLPDYSEHIDYQCGLELLGGNRTLYGQLLRNFFNRHFNDHDKIRLAIQEQRFDEASRLAHKLKGLSGTIGANQLMKSTKALERALTNKQSESLARAMDKFAEDLRKVLDTLAQIYNTPDTGKSAPKEIRS